MILEFITLAVFGLVTFLFVWFLIFKLKLMIDSRRILKDIDKKLERQNKKFFNDGNEVDLKKELALQGPKEDLKKEVKKDLAEVKEVRQIPLKEELPEEKEKPQAPAEPKTEEVKPKKKKKLFRLTLKNPEEKQALGGSTIKEKDGGRQ